MSRWGRVKSYVYDSPGKRGLFSGGATRMRCLRAEEVCRPQADDFPAFGSSLELEAHLCAAALRGREGIGWILVHLDVDGGGSYVFVGGHLQQLIAKLDTFVKAKKSHQLVPKLGVVKEALRVEDVQNLVQVMGLEATLKAG